MSNAVYLIVAGVLLGPIDLVGSYASSDSWTEAQKQERADCFAALPPVIREQVNPSTPGLIGTWPADRGPIPCWPTRTREGRVRETCERAMKEIGAEYGIRKPTEHERAIGYLGMIGWSVAGKEVLCIPVPSGMKR